MQKEIVKKKFTLHRSAPGTYVCPSLWKKKKKLHLEWKSESKSSPHHFLAMSEPQLMQR